jgi:hypothetical protein
MVCAVHIPAINYQQYEEEKPTHQNATRPKRGSKTINIRRNQRNTIVVYENMKTQTHPAYVNFKLNEYKI